MVTTAEMNDQRAEVVWKVTQGDDWVRPFRVLDENAVDVTDQCEVIAQARVPVLAGDDEAALAARVRAIEHPLLVETVRLLAEDRLRLRHHRRRRARSGSSLRGATRHPGGSEVVLFSVLKLHPEQYAPALAIDKA